MPRKPERPADSYNTALPARLRETMLSKGITQQELGEQIGKSRQAVAQYWNGSSSPDWATIAAIAKYLNVSSDYLLGLSEVASPDATIQGICNYTGLNEDAVYTLQANKAEPDFIHGINTVLEEPVSCWVLMGTISDAIKAKEYNPEEAREFMEHILDFLHDPKQLEQIDREEDEDLEKEFLAWDEEWESTKKAINDLRAKGYEVLDHDEIASYLENKASNLLRDLIQDKRKAYWAGKEEADHETEND